MDLPIGQSGDMVIAVNNNGPDTAKLIEIGGSWNLDTRSSQYSLESATATCGTILSDGPPPFTDGYHLELGPLSVGQTVHCVIRVTRNVTGVNSTTFEWAVFGSKGDPSSHDWTAFQVGTLTDVAISTQTISFHLDQNGVGQSLVRVHAKNKGPSDVEGFNIGACTDNVSLPFFVDLKVANACTLGGILCFDDGFAFHMPPLQAGVSTSCDVLLTGVGPYTGPAVFPLPLGIGDPLFDPATKGSLIDTNSSNNSAYLALAAPPTQPAPTGSPFIEAALIACLAVIGLAAVAPRLGRGQV